MRSTIGSWSAEAERKRYGCYACGGGPTGREDEEHKEWKYLDINEIPTFHGDDGFMHEGSQPFPLNPSSSTKDDQFVLDLPSV